MKKTEKSVGGTSYQFVDIKATLKMLRSIFGEPTYETNDGKDKTNVEWSMETENGDVFCVYDWKQYRPIDETETIEWHIGSNSQIISLQAKSEIEEAIKKVVNY